MALGRCFNLKFSNAKMENEYSSLKAKNIVSDYRVTMSFLFLINILLFVNFVVYGKSLDLFVSIGTVVAIIIPFLLHRWIKKYIPVIILIIFCFYAISRMLIIMNDYYKVTRGTLYLQGYFIGTMQHIIISRLPKTEYKIMGAIVGYLLRMGIIIGAISSRNLEPVSIIRHFLIDAFLVFMFYSNEKDERKVFQNYFENREELVKFKELLADSLPISVTVFNIDAKKTSFSNNMFLDTFEAFSNDKSYGVFESGQGLLNASNDLSKPQISSLNVDITSIREVEVLETQEPSWNLARKHVGLMEAIDIFVKERALSNKAMSLAASCQWKSQQRSFDVVLKRIRWDRHDCVAIILHDITYQQNLNALKVANTNKDKLIATVSHELRTPLHGIIDTLEASRKKTENTEVLDYLSICKDHARLLLSLVNSIVDFHQMSTGKLRLNPTKVDIRKEIKDVLSLFHFQCNQKELYIEEEIGISVPDYIITDENRLKQILITLVSNAVKFTFHGGIKVKVMKDPQEIDCIQILVSDTGVGITEEDKKKLFNMYRMSENRESVGKSGVGLGLTMANSLALILSDKRDKKGIQVKSEYGKGSCFYFDVSKKLENTAEENEIAKNKKGDEPEYIKQEENFSKEQDETFLTHSRIQPPSDIGLKLAHYISPVRESAYPIRSTPKVPSFTERLPISDDIKIVREPFQVSTNSDCHHKKLKSEVVVVVDDFPFNLLVARNLVNSIGYQIRTARGGHEALELVKSCHKEGQAIKVILMDCQMPVMDGYETTKILKSMMESNEIQKVPILAWTANNSKEDIQRCFESGMEGHVVKPTSKETLEKVLAGLKDIL